MRDKVKKYSLGIIVLVLVSFLNMLFFPVAFALALDVQSPKIIQVGAGNFFTSVLKDDGTVWAWGGNYDGSLGDGTTIGRATPKQIEGLTDIISIASGYDHGLALKSDGTVWAWGRNVAGQLGDGTLTGRLRPIQVPGLTDVVSIKAGYSNSVALKRDGTVWQWGQGFRANMPPPVLTPTQVLGLEGVISITESGRHTLALKSDGTVWAWGDNNAGELGDGTQITRTTPVQVSGLTGVIAVSATYAHSLALKSDGTIWSWGANDYGQLGDGTTTSHKTPAKVFGMTDVISISAGNFNSFAIKKDGTVWSWGLNTEGDLGIGTVDTSSTTYPLQVTVPDHVVAVYGSSTFYYTMLLQEDGSLWVTGREYYGAKSAVFVRQQGFGTVEFTAIDSSPTTVDLKYGANVAVKEYVVKRGNRVLTCPKSGTNLTCQDREVSPGISYTYTLEAYGEHNCFIGSKTQTVKPSVRPSAKVVADQTGVSAGETFTTRVMLEQAVDLFAEDITISYDPTLFTFIKAETASAGLKIYHQSESAPGTVRLVVVSQGAQYGLQDTAQLLNVTLQANAIAGKGTIEVSQGLVANSRGEEIVPTVGGTEISVIRMDADVNGDGRFSLGDLAIAGHHYGMDQSNWSYPKADVDGSGDVNDFDLSTIVQAIFAGTE